MPNKKQPIIFTMKILSICQRKIAAGTAPSEIKKKILFFRELYIYWLPIKEPIAKAIKPKDNEKIKSFNALKNLYFNKKSNRS